MVPERDPDLECHQSRRLGGQFRGWRDVILPHGLVSHSVVSWDVDCCFHLELTEAC